MRQIAVIGASSNIGIRPYDSGELRHIDQAPGVYRELGLVKKIGADDLGDVTPPPYQDFLRPPGRPRNEQGVAAYSRALADRVEHATAAGQFTLVLGGDCSIVLGSLLGAGRAAGPIGLVYIDAHADFATPEQSRTGSVASMCLALTVGHGDSELARLAGNTGLVQPRDVVMIGRRDESEPGYGDEELVQSDILDLPDTGLWLGDVRSIAAQTLARVARDALNGFWIHVDSDVLDPRVMPAVDSPEPGGPNFEQLAALLVPLAAQPRALGLQITLYDPSLDRDRKYGTGMVEMMSSALRG
ncbi:MAG: arginase family protein [Longimicrobiales bacterium]